MLFHVLLCYGEKFGSDIDCLNTYSVSQTYKIKTETPRLVDASMKIILHSAWANTDPAFNNTTGVHGFQLDGVLTAGSSKPIPNIFPRHPESNILAPKYIEL